MLNTKKTKVNTPIQKMARRIIQLGLKPDNISILPTSKKRERSATCVKGKTDNATV
jgi:hypothetical protein